MRVLTWNLFHGRSVPPSGRDLSAAFATRLAEWDWDVALLQEVPPWWPPLLARAAEAEARVALTSRNAGLAIRRALGRRRPDLMKSNAGGSNAVLSRVGIREHRAIRLRTRPERRVAQLVRLPSGICVANYHGSARARLAEDELEQLWQRALAFAGKAPLILGGDLNLRSPGAPAPGVAHVASRDVDHLFAHRLRASRVPYTPARRLELDGRSVELSDHPPLAVALA